MDRNDDQMEKALPQQPSDNQAPPPDQDKEQPQHDKNTDEDDNNNDRTEEQGRPVTAVDYQNDDNNVHHDGSAVVVVGKQQQQQQEDVEIAVTTPTTVVENKSSSSSSFRTLSQRLCTLYQQQEFLIWILSAIGLAKLYPRLGGHYFAPHITSDWLAVILIFLLSGISLRTSELIGAVATHWQFHLVVQLFSLGVVPAIVYGLTRTLLAIGDDTTTNNNGGDGGSVLLARPLADGMVICACLPMTINMVMVLTKAAGGDDASALVGAVLGNGLGVVISPLLILGYLGVRGNVHVGEVFIKLALRVLLPVLIGQVLQKTTTVYEVWYQPHKKWVAKGQQLLLAFIVYTVFCETFLEDQRQVRVSDVFLMVLFQFLLLTSLMVIVWYGLLRRVAPSQRVMGLFGCTHKTVAIGIPLINALYENSSSSSNNSDGANNGDKDNGNAAALVALYALPLLVWHPLQLVLGTLLTPYLAAYVTANATLPAHNNEEASDEEEEPTTTAAAAKNNCDANDGDQQR